MQPPKLQKGMKVLCDLKNDEILWHGTPMTNRLLGHLSHPMTCHAGAQHHHASIQPAIPPGQHDSWDSVTSVVNMGIVPVSVGPVVAAVL